MKKTINLLVIFFIILMTACNTKRNAIKKEYDEFAYVELQNNNVASLEIGNQIIFLRKQLKRKIEGKQYSSIIAENVITLSNIKSNIESLGTYAVVMN